jgi:transcriptional regulator with XRE-family HTH domain
MSLVETENLSVRKPAKRLGPKSPTQIDEDIGRRVKARRMELGMSLTALGDIIGVGHEQTRKYEFGSNRISYSMLLRIATALEIPAAALLGEKTSSIEPESSLGERMVATRQGCAMAQAWEKVSSSKARQALIDMAGMMKGIAP